MKNIKLSALFLLSLVLCLGFISSVRAEETDHGRDDYEQEQADEAAGRRN